MQFSQVIKRPTQMASARSADTGCGAPGQPRKLGVLYTRVVTRDTTKIVVDRDPILVAADLGLTKFDA